MGAKSAQAPSLNILMVEIGKISGEVGDKSGNTFKKRGKRILSNILDKPFVIFLLNKENI